MDVDQLRMKVQRIVTEKFGSVKVFPDGDLQLVNNSAIGLVGVRQWGEDQTIVKVSSWLLSEVPITPEVFEWVATEGQNHWFAHARVFVDDDGTGAITWEHDLLGDFLDPDELIEVIYSVVGAADDLDDELQAKFGGKRAADR